jgi:anthranilate phosphoribosyltransferase
MSSAILNRLLDGESLSRTEAGALLEQMMDGAPGPELAAAILTALRMKGESIDELTGFAEVMRSRCIRVPVAPGPDLIDTCGTGGDNSGSFNVSTATAFVAAGMGLRVAKHGNRSVSSRCGSADVLEELGVCVTLSPENMAGCIEQCGIGFLFAPLLHPAMGQIAPVRRALGIRTFFNMLGPLSNPAGARCQLIGCFSGLAALKMGAVLQELHCDHAMLVHSRDGLDEISTCAETDILIVRDGQTMTTTVSPEDLGLRRADRAELQGGGREQNASIIREVLEGQSGAARDIVLANAAACAVLGGLADELRDGVKLAAESIDSGRALERLERLIALSHKQEVAR